MNKTKKMNNIYRKYHKENESLQYSRNLEKAANLLLEKNTNLFIPNSWSTVNYKFIHGEQVNNNKYTK